MKHDPKLEQEIRFYYRDPNPRIPAWVDGKLGIYEWGNRDRSDTRLPKTGWCRDESLFNKESKWMQYAPRKVEIPAIYGWENNHWFKIDQGIVGVLVLDEDGKQHIYMVTEPASIWYKGVLEKERMPRLIGQLL